MGRHGGGSRSGGSSSSRSSRSCSGSRSGGGRGNRISKKPFYGCYNRSYVNRRGVFVPYYTEDSRFGTKSGWNPTIIFILCFITVHMFLMLTSFIPTVIVYGDKVNGNIERICIKDNANILTEKEETEILKLLNDVYDKSGMPVTLYTDDFKWKNHYASLEIYSEELYYGMGFDEDAMIILFTTETVENFYDWEYDMYCGDETITCLSDATFDKLLINFHKAMGSQDLTKALNYAWGTVINDLAKTSIAWSKLPVLLVLVLLYGIFYVAIFCIVKKENDAYHYFQENPGKLSTCSMNNISIKRHMELMNKKCSYCGTENTSGLESCTSCGNQF